MIVIEFDPQKGKESAFNLRVRAAISQYEGSNASLSVFASNVREDISKIKRIKWGEMNASIFFEVILSADYSQVEVIEKYLNGDKKCLVATIIDNGVKAKEFPWD